MVLSSGKRSFTITHVVKSDGCETKHTKSRLISSTPVGAAKKAFSRQCRLKKIKGVCSFTVVIQETTAGAKSRGKQYAYKCSRIKLEKPVVRFEGTKREFRIHYTTVAKSVKELPEGCKKSSKSPGPMLSSPKNKKKSVARKAKSTKATKKSSPAKKKSVAKKSTGKKKVVKKVRRKVRRKVTKKKKVQKGGDGHLASENPEMTETPHHQAGGEESNCP